MLLLGTFAAGAAPPLVPQQTAYQGLLLDGAGSPRTGSVDLTLRIWDALTGGILVYKQSFSGVALSDGVFTVNLGPAGEASDTPVDPLTTSFVDALAGDVGPTGPDRFLEVTVGLEGALTRTQILSAPYALHAETADTAKMAETAEVAASADDTSSVGGLDASFVTQLYEHTNLDNEEPPNTDPDEGLADVDGDGMANFIDPDNDGDGISDGTELLQGSQINLVTPVLADVQPASGDADLTQTVALSGTGFEPGMAVSFGSESPVPSNVTATSADVAVGPQAPGVVSVSVTRLNAESSNSSSYEFVKIAPDITGFGPPFAPVNDTTVVTLLGVNFEPDMSVVFGSETPTPMNVTPTSAQVAVGPQTGVVDVTVTLVNGNADTEPFTFVGLIPFAVPHSVAGGGQRTFDVTGIQQTILGSEVEYGADTDGDRNPELILPFTSNSQTTPGQIAVAWDPAGAAAGLRCRPGATAKCTVELAVDSDGDFELEDETGVVIESLTGSLGRIESPGLVFDASGRPFAGYVRREFVVPDLVLARDLDGDGQFNGPNEVYSPGTVSFAGLDLGDAAASAGGAVAYATRISSDDTRLYYDLGSSGTYASFSLRKSAVTCVGVAFVGETPFLLVGGNISLVLKSANSSLQSIPSGPVTACDVEGGAGPLAIAHNGDGLRLLVDRDGDGDFTGPLEDIVLEQPTLASSVRLERNADGVLFIATDQAIFVDPTALAE